MTEYINAQYTKDFKEVVLGLAKKGDKEMITLYEQLENNTLKLGDHSLQSSKLVGGQTGLILIDPSANDDRDISLRNFDRARLNKEQFFMPTSIQLELATYAGLSIANLKTIQYGSIQDCGNPPNDGIIANGEINFRSRNLILYQNTPLNKWVTGLTPGRVGDVPMGIRRIFRPNDEIYLELRFGAAAPADYGLRVTIHGIVTLPNAG